MADAFSDVALIGAGTVLSVEDVGRVAQAGANSSSPPTPTSASSSPPKPQHGKLAGCDDPHRMLRSTQGWRRRVSRFFQPPFSALKGSRLSAQSYPKARSFTPLAARAQIISANGWQPLLTGSHWLCSLQTRLLRSRRQSLRHRYGRGLQRG